MTNPFFQPGQERASRVKELFARIAPKYDLINDLQSFGLHRYWKSRMVSLADPKPEELALDLCCGTGDLAGALAKRGARVIGADFSEQMLSVAWHRNQPADLVQANTPASGHPNHGAQAHYVQADAMSLPFSDHCFQIVTVGYGLRNLADVRAGLCEIQRVAKPAARVLILDFGKPDNALWRAIYFTYLRLFVPVLGLTFCGSASAYAYILESLKHYPAQHGVAAYMRELGFENVRIVNFLGGVMTINYGEKPSTFL